MMYPKPIKRKPKPGKRLERHTRLKARGNTKHARRERDFSYMGKVARLPCVAKALASDFVPRVCAGRIQVDHAFGRYGKGADLETIPLCEKHHREKTGAVGGRGFMSGWSLAARRGWLTIAIGWTRAAVEERGER